MTLDDRVLLVDKPAGITSFAVVRRLRRAARLDKVGHSGSLDPLATGMLVLCTGIATRVASVFVDLPKIYRARVRFGRATDSYDADGRTTAEAPVPALDPEVVRAALRRFEGEIQQRPPMVSAVKVQGKRLYEHARRGEEIDRAARTVVVHEIELESLRASEAQLLVRCGRGCYVRSIAHELGEMLGVPAHLEALRRMAIGGFDIERAASLEAFESMLGVEGGDATPLASAVLTLPQALADLPALHLRPTFEPGILHGVQPAAHALRTLPQRGGKHVLLSDDGRRLLGLVDVGAAHAEMRLALVFQAPIRAQGAEPA